MLGVIDFFFFLVETKGVSGFHVREDVVWETEVVYEET